MKPFTLIFVGISLLGIILLWPGSGKLPAKEFAYALKNNKEAYLIDLRSADQFSDGHIAGAMNIPWLRPTFRARIAELDTFRTVYLYCNAGEYDELAMSYLKFNGFVSYYSLEDGIQSWKAEKMTVTPPELVPPDEMYFQDFSRLLDLEHLVIVDFYIPWETDCQHMEPLIDALAVDNRKKLKVLRINIDKYKHLATEMGIETVPFLQFYENGNLVSEMEGVGSRKEIEKELLLDEYLIERHHTLSFSTAADKY